VDTLVRLVSYHRGSAATILDSGQECPRSLQIPMLDTATKRRIDTARDILVGKVPDPKSQVEQITIALIYKFMDDMDAEAEELGGMRSFFTGPYAKYGWAKLMSPSLGGHEMLGLYGEGISKMPENPGIPALFREIFKNAYLPYRDPETLKAFLKIINEFSYDHSERLGDAFEYLLSVLGSQGDAGQFRTPRHIIDFMVEIVAPQKGETVLDPACGTAGFLISAYKHILRTNTDATGHSTLTPDDRSLLAKNIKGYDISPDMVRLSLVNLYLHGFTDPHIYEYDTLTSEERWNEFADVILANPPFMSPKGGIKPHKRFSIQAKRSEVLFVDYMAEHLTPTGRAAIIVPEGIIFQSQGAYTELRKMLVENSLVAVVSLPAGCFNPYSGVKTSILILDKSLARQSDTIGFFKVENDGFGLGAQRRPIEKNDLPQIQSELSAYLNALRSNSTSEPTQPLGSIPPIAQIVPKAKIATNGDYNLSGERYGEQTRLSQSNWPTVPLGKICSFMTGGTPTSTVAEYYENGTIPWLVSGDIHSFEIWDCEKRITQKAVENSNARILPKNSVLIALNGQGKTRGTVAILRMEGATCNQSLVAITPMLPLQALPEFIFWILRAMYSEIRALTGDNERSGLNMPILRGIQIPLPPLKIQKEIVTEIEGYQKVINGARLVLDHYRPYIPIHPDWPMAIFGGVTSTITPPMKIQTSDYRQEGRFPVIDQSQNPIAGRTDDETALVDGSNGLVIFGDHTCAVKFVAERFAQGADGIKIIKVGPQLVSKYVYFYLLSRPIDQDGYKRHFSKLKESSIPVPPLATQQAIVAEIEAEQALVAANRELITRFEKKIQTTLARIWGGEHKP
jgi:type I restriction enzyme M protein